MAYGLIPHVQTKQSQDIENETNVQQRYGNKTEKGEHWALLESAPWKQV